MVVAPDGTVLGNLGREPGVLTVDLDPCRKWVKPRSHGQPEIEHRVLIEESRRKLRAEGSLAAERGNRRGR